VAPDPADEVVPAMETPNKRARNELRRQPEPTGVLAASPTGVG